MNLRTNRSSSRRSRSRYIKKVREKNDKVARVVKEMKKVGIKVLKNKEQQVKENLVLKKEKIYISKDKELRTETIWLHHDIPVPRHGG